MFKKNTYLIIYCSIWIIFNSISIYLGSNCETLDLYKIFSLTDLFIIITSPIISFFILSLGRFLYRLLSKKLNYKLKIFSFTIISLISLYHPIYIISMKLFNEKTKASICNKSIYKGLFAESKNLTFEEYEFIRKSCNFPQIPINSKSIYLKYYEDDFLGDYSTEIHFNIGIKDTFNNTKRWKSEEWNIIKIDSKNKFKTILYTDFMN